MFFVGSIWPNIELFRDYRDIYTSGWTKYKIKIKALIHGSYWYLFHVQDAMWKKYHLPETNQKEVEISWSARKSPLTVSTFLCRFLLIKGILEAVLQENRSKIFFLQFFTIQQFSNPLDCLDTIFRYSHQSSYNQFSIVHKYMASLLLGVIELIINITVRAEKSYRLSRFGLKMKRSPPK